MKIEIFFFFFNYEVSWGGIQLWEAHLNPYHNSYYKFQLEMGGTGSPNVVASPIKC